MFKIRKKIEWSVYFYVWVVNGNVSEVYSEPSRTSKIESFSNNMFNWVLNTPYG